MSKVPCLLLIALALSAPARAGAQPTARFNDLPLAAPEPAPPGHEAPRQPPTRHEAPRQSPPGHEAPRPATTAAVAPPSHSWARNSIAELMRRARLDEQHGDAARAMADYTEAAQLDPTYGPALIRLGRLREAAGDVREAEQLYTRAARLHEYAAQALEHRARLFRHIGREAEAFRDLRAAIDLDDTNTALRRELASWYAQRRMWPAALAQWRRLVAQLKSNPASPALGEARLQVRALGVLAAACDPVRAGAADSNWVRRALAHIARTR